MGTASCWRSADDDPTARHEYEPRLHSSWAHRGVHRHRLAPLRGGRVVGSAVADTGAVRLARTPGLVDFDEP